MTDELDPSTMTMAQRHALLTPGVNIGYVADVLIWTLLFECVDGAIVQDARALKARAIAAVRNPHVGV